MMATSNLMQVLNDLEQWNDRYQAGKIRHIALRKPKLEPGERLSVHTHQVGYAQVERSRIDAQPAGWGSTSMLGRPVGGAYATDTRLFIVSNGLKILHEWKWADIAGVRAMADMQGVVVEQADGADTLEVVATDHSAAVEGPRPLQAAAAWLAVEATFVDSRGGLEQWMAGLRSRMEQLEKR